MRKVLLGAAAWLAAAVLCGCSAAGGVSAQEVSDAVAQPFTAQLQVVCGGSEYAAQLSRDADSLDVVMDAPALFSGMAISFPVGGGNAEVDFNGISFTVDPDDLPGASAVAAVVSVLDTAAVPDRLTTEVRDGTAVILGDGFELQLLSSDSAGNEPLTAGLPFSEIRLSIPEHNITAVVADFTPVL